MPLAQLNIARMRFPMDSPGMATFVSQLADVNAGAESADGFIWRLKDEDGPGVDELPDPRRRRADREPLGLA